MGLRYNLKSLLELNYIFQCGLLIHFLKIHFNFIFGYGKIKEKTDKEFHDNIFRVYQKYNNELHKLHFTC